MTWIDSLDPGDEVEVVVGGKDSLDAVIDHRGGVDRVTGGDGRDRFHQLEGPVRFSEGYGKTVVQS